MRRPIIALLAVLGSAGTFLAPSLPAMAQGCGPTRLKVNESVTLDMPPAAAWAAVGNFQDMGWDRDASGVAGTGGNEADRATRTVTLRDGTTLAESLYRYDAAAMTYASTSIGSTWRAFPYRTRPSRSR